MAGERRLPSNQEIIDVLPDPFVLIDADYRIVAANRHYLSHYGIASDDVVGRHCYEVSHHSDTPCSQNGEACPLERVKESGQATQVLHVHFDSDGEEERVAIHGTPFFDPQTGEVAYMGEQIKPVHQDSGEHLLIGRSPALLNMISLAHRVAPTDTTVLLEGESGAGKECVAEYIHRYSNRESGPLVVVDCAALGEQLIGSELFGHEKGAFTGADKRKRGLIESADGGTLFIDEIGELPLDMQTKLLRVLETGTIRTVGGTRYSQVNIRIVAATHRNLRAMADAGEFRKDLFYRLTAFPIRVPSLRERKEDVPLLAEHFLGRQPNGSRQLPLAPEVIQRLLEYDYPGNVRELRNIMERALILAAGDSLRAEHLVMEDMPEDRAAQAPRLVPKIFDRRRGRLDESAVLHALERHGGNRRAAADDLQVSERTLYRYLNRLRESQQP